MFKKISAAIVALSVMLFIACTLIGLSKVSAQTPPSGFASVTVSDQWNEAVGLTFSADGTDMFVWERGGRVWVVTDNQKRLLLDISEEVGAWHDLGMLGFTLHPDFDQNGYFYVLYTVDRHHLINFGTGAYSPTTNNYFSATINRLTRYTAVKTANVYTVSPSSRKILIGATKSTGIPQLSNSHGPGSLVFGTDKTLLVSVGDGSPASYDVGSHPSSHYAQALIDGIITPKENIGTFRSQSPEMFNGKILRINPETGEGIPSNPFYDPARPFAPISCVYALGLRQPFKMNKKPGTGSHNPADGNPGILYVGDVGWTVYEELDVVDKPAMNFGWPIYEGLTLSPLAPTLVPNVDAPNPLYQVNGCNQQYFNFQDLLKQPTLSGNTNFPNPCNSGQSIPASARTFVHSRPLIDWRHTNALSRTGIFNGETAGVINIGAPGSPVSGPQFFGSAAVGGVFYTGDDFPPEYRNTFFFGDYSGGWLKNLVVDDSDKPVAVRNFIDDNAIVVGMATHPTEEGLYYINFPSEIKRVYYGNNRPPVAVASVNNTFGPSPLALTFTGSNSVDPENQPLLYEWNFGDGSPLSTTANPSHSFTAPAGSPTKYTVTLTVTDNEGETSQATVIISVNNTPPQISITSPVNNSLYTMNEETTYSLQATVTDQEHSSNQLTYGWQTILHHEEHSHPSPVDNSPTSTTTISPVGCDGETYFYQIVLTVTDPAGGSATDEVRIYPDCDNAKFSPLITWAAPAPITYGTALSAVQLNATATYNGSAVPGTFAYTPGIGTILAAGNNQPLIANFTPTDNSLYNSASKTVFINVAPPTASGFYRAINLNGPGLSIDGNNWAASTGAPNFSYTTNRGVINSQAITLIPGTDANRASMIRSSIWGTSVNLVVSAIPAGSYQVWLYVWEDNTPSIFSVSVEGSVVLSNYNSGPGGTWRKLGPYAVTINDGILDVSTSGGHSNLSGLEIWGSQPVGNQDPVVSNAIPDQSATSGTAFSFTFASNTFTDPDAGTTLTYSAILSGGNALPGWLNFNAGTRNFSGSPSVADEGVLQVVVTASDGSGGTVSDTFILTVSEPVAKIVPLISWSNPAAISEGIPLSSSQLNATASHNGSPVAGTFTYTPPSGTLLDEGTGQLLRAKFFPTNTTLYDTISKVVSIDVLAAPASGFYRAINLNGPGLSIDGNNWAASTGAPNFSYTTNRGVINSQAITLIPGTDANRASMIRSSIWGTSVNLVVSAIPAGSYQVWLYVWEDNTPSIFSVSVEGSVVLSNYNSGPGGTWRKLGPYAVTINDGILDVSTSGGHSNLSGLEIWGSQPVGNQDPVVSNAIPDQSATSGTAFSFTFASNTFTDPDAGTTLTYSASLSGGNALPGWLNFNAGTRNFSGSPSVDDEGVLQVVVTASDGSGGTVSDTFTLTVSEPVAKIVPLISWSNPAAISEGIPLSSTQLNATASHNGSPVAGTFTYTPPSGTLLDEGSDQLLRTKFFPTNTILYDTISKTVTIDVNEAVKVVPLITWANPAAITTGTALSSTQLNATASYNGSPVAGSFTYTPPSGTLLDEGTGQLLRAKFFPTNTVLYDTISKVVSIDVLSTPISAFYRAINFNGPAFVIDGNSWVASTGASNFSYTTNRGVFASQGITLNPATDANRAAMIRSSIWGTSVNLVVSSVPAGSYQVWLYTWEDNNPAIFSVSVEGALVLSNYNSGTAGTWRKLGPYEVTVNDGTINVSTSGGHTNLSGLEIWTNNSSPSAGRLALTNSDPNAFETEYDEQPEFLAYPNPFSGKLNVEFTPRETASTQLAIYDIRGVQVRVLLKSNSQAGIREKLEIDTGDIPDGVYVLELVNGKRIRHIRLAATR